MALYRKTLYTLVAIGAIYWLISYLMPFVLPAETTVNLMTREDSLMEYLTFVFFFLAGVFFVLMFIQSHTGNNFLFIRTKKNFIYLLFALVFFFGAGEEISWGQRIFGFSTPDELAEVNEQGEVTVHNLPMFNSSDPSNLFQMNRLFLMFWFVFTVVIPLVSKLSARVRLWLIQIGMPIANLEFGVMLCIAYAASKIYVEMEKFDEIIYSGRITEVRENQEALLLMLASLALYLVVRQQAKAQVQAPVAVQGTVQA